MRCSNSSKSSCFNSLLLLITFFAKFLASAIFFVVFICIRIINFYILSTLAFAGVRSYVGDPGYIFHFKGTNSKNVNYVFHKLIICDGDT